RNVPIFIGKGDVENARDPGSEVLACMGRAWPVKPVSESFPVRGPLNMVVRERKSGQRGWLLWMENFPQASSKTIKVRCGIYSDGTAFEMYEFTLDEDAKGWTLRSERNLGIG